MNRALFVDDDPHVLQGLRRMLRDLRHEWEMEFAAGGEEALARLAAAPAHVVVTDMRMPGMDGAQLLTEVRRRHPGTVRIVLSGQADGDAVIRTVETAHQYLAKPCDAETLKAAIGRAGRLGALLADDSLKSLVSRLGSLPSLPALYVRLLKECRSPSASLQAVGDIIADDVAMTAKTLQLVNSSFFGVRTRVVSPLQAVQLLGLETVKALALSAGVFSQFEELPLPGFSVDALWRHSARTSTYARIVAAAERPDADLAADAAVAGLLHDVGALVAAANLPAQLAEAHRLAVAEHLSVSEAEMRTFGATHATIGAYLLGLWGLPDAIVEAAAYHHEPRRAQASGFTPLTAVHVAQCLARAAGDGAGPAGLAGPEPDVAYLSGLGLHDRFQIWRERCAAHEES